MTRMACMLLLALLLAGCGRGSGELLQEVASGNDNPVLDASLTETTLHSPGLELPPFPGGSDAAERHISDDTVVLQGRDWFDKSDDAEQVGSTLELNGSDNTWGIYVLGGFGQVKPGSVFANFWTEDAMPCHVFIGVADFASGRWVFLDAGKDDESFVFPAGGEYHSPEGNCYVTVLRYGEGKAKLYSLSFGRVGNTDLDSPAGLVAVADPGVVSLDWLPVDNALGYNIYRAYDKKFTDQVKLNDEPVSTDEYEDSWLTSGEMYFYRVTAVAAIESQYSSAVNVYVPAADLPAPQNLRAVDVGDFHFEIAWDWEGSSPSSWVVFLANSADFNLDPPTEQRSIPHGGSRKYKFSELDPGRLYFVRMAARDSSGKLGRMTEALPCLTGEQWEWYDVEEIGDGKEPVSAVIADGQICAAYMLDREVHVALNSGQGEPWTVESTALDRSIHVGGFSSYLDMDYSTGTFLICSVTSQSLDYYAAIGAPGEGWNVELIDKGTKNGEFSVPAAGLYASCAISDNGYSAAGLDFEVGYHTYSRPFGKGQPWSKHYQRAVPSGWPIEWDFEVQDGRLFASCFDYSERQLLLWSEDAGEFSQVSDNPEGWTFGLQFTDLELVSGSWKLTAYDGYNRNLMLLSEGEPGQPWDEYLITNSEDYKTGKGARMEPFRDGLVCVYMGGGIRDWYCSVLRGNGEWETQLMKIGEIDAYERADLKILNDKPVFIVADKITQKVYAIRGNIPAE